MSGRPYAPGNGPEHGGPSASGGLKYDGEKPMVSLLSSKWVLGVSDVLTFGAKKYAAHNWRKGLEASRLLSAAQRHILAFQDGEDTDPESKLSHLLHASCCLMFLYENQLMRPETDDRWKDPKYVQPEQPQTTGEISIVEISKLSGKELDARIKNIESMLRSYPTPSR